MHTNGKTEYKRNGISITIVPEGEKIKVRIKAEGSPDDAIQVEDEEIEEEEAS